MKKLREFFEKYQHGIPLLIYMVIYLAWFAWLEKKNVRNYQVIHVVLDDYIPFCEIFIIPYLLWFGYVSVVVLYLLFKNRQDYYKVCAFLFTGMTLFLIISTLWPNGHHLRPAVLPRDNCLTWLVGKLWETDTPTNLWPSIHVYNSLGAHFAVMRSKDIASLKWGGHLRRASGLLAGSIVLSTVFIKQHSMFDVATGLLFGIIMYVLVYKKELLLVSNPENRNKRTPQAG
ncbi:MAG: serine/threonine protein phosphatase [Roseburia sp.]|nr:serine/threonine protein phosphatase [Roseburia sp.]MCM1097027.1 serine/threonine protein phosphatase [Ruminococcus flavefaciens]